MYASVACQLFWACNMCWPCRVAELALVTYLYILLFFPGCVSAGTGLRAGAALSGKIVFYFVFFGNLGRIARPHA